MARWRSVKNSPKTIDSSSKEDENSLNIPTFFVRFKSFMVDLFMLYVPIVYLLAYLMFDGAKDFRNSELAGILSMAIYGLISIIFWVKSGQTPGKRAYDLVLIDNQSQKLLNPFRAFLRYIAFIFSATLIIGVLLPLFRKDKKALQDILTDTSVVYKI
jgi:uncharacterized RDD family membrane protein YckC